MLCRGGDSKGKTTAKGRDGKETAKGKEVPKLEEGEEKGDLLIQDIWNQGMDSIHNMLVVNTDAVSYQSNTPDKCIETAKLEKKRKYLNACLNKRRNFTPFFALVDGLL